jgi:hypothetical protein
MARYVYTGTTAAALANGNAVASIVPTASVGFKLRRVILGCTNSAGAVTDTQLAVGINRATARGTSSGTATGVALDPLAPASPVTAVDNAWSGQPTLAAADGVTIAYNTRGGADTAFEGIEEFQSTVGTANPIVLVQRSGGALPASHSITWTVEIEA